MEKENLKHEYDKIIKELDESLQKSYAKFNSLTPRAIIEYVEYFLMNEKKYQGQNRVKKWAIFFDDTKEGRAILECIRNSTPGWQENAQGMAVRIASIYQFTSDYYHATSHGIAAKEVLVLDKLAHHIQIYNAMVCIADVLGIQYKAKNDANLS